MLESRTPRQPLAPLSAERFAEIFSAYIQMSDEKQRMIASYTDIIGPRVQSVLSKGGRDKLNVFDLACGNGQTITMLIGKIIDGGLPADRIKLTARDAAFEMVNQYEKNVRNAFPDIELDLSLGDALFCVEEKWTCRADIALLSHAAYHVEPTELSALVSRVSSLLVSSGVGLISLLRDDSDFQIIQDRFVGAFERNSDSHLSVKTPSFGYLDRSVKSVPQLAAITEVLPYEASLWLPISLGQFESFKSEILAADSSRPLDPQFSATKGLLEFILHRDWDSLASSGRLNEFLTLVASMIKINHIYDDERARLQLGGASLVVRS
jgi:SAM-dependent methyltransferase